MSDINTVINSISTLSDLCLHTDHHEIVDGYLQQLTEAEYEYERDDLDDLLDFTFYCEDNNIPFIWRLDWKTDIDALKACIELSLSNFGIQAILPTATNFPRGTSISSDNVLESFNYVLQQEKLQLQLITSNDDQFLIIVHRKKDKQAVDAALHQIDGETEDIGISADWKNFVPDPKTHPSYIKAAVAAFSALIVHPEFLDRVNKIIDSNEGENGLDYIIDLAYELEKMNIPYVKHIERREPVAVSHQKIAQYLKANFNLETALPPIEDFPTKTIITHKNVLKRFDSALQEHGLKFGTISIDASYLLLFIHEKSKLRSIKEALQSLECQYEAIASIV